MQSLTGCDKVLCEHNGLLVVENLMKNNRMTLQDIANLAGLNKMTVSRYLRDPNQVSQRSRELISKIMEENNYIPNRAPEILLNARSKTIGVLIPSFRNQIFADVLAGGRSRSPVNVSAAEACLALYLPCEALLRPCAALHSAHLKLLQNWLETISDKYFALDRRLELICCKSLRGRICMWLLEQRERCGADTFSTAMTRTELAAFLNCDRSALSRELSRMQEEGLIELFRGSFKLPDPERLHAACPQF